MNKPHLHLHIIVNPTSGSGKAKKILEATHTFFEDKKIVHTTYLTTHPGHEKNLAKKLVETVLIPWENHLDSFPLLLVLGGDGTIHGVTNALFDYPDIPIAYLPAGSGNDFARGIGLPRKISDSLNRILEIKEPTSIELIATRFNTNNSPQVVLNNIGIGLDARIVATANESPSKKRLNQLHLGSLSYLSAVFSVLRKQTSFSISFQTESTQKQVNHAYLCTITNHPYFGGGVPIDPTASVKEKQMSLILLEKTNIFVIFYLICRLSLKKHLSSKYIQHYKCQELHLEAFETEYCQTDGEIISHAPQSVQCTMTSRLFWC